MLDKLFVIVLFLNATSLFRFVAPQLGVSIGLVSIALLLFTVFYLVVKLRYTLPVFLRSGMGGWLLVLLVWPLLTVVYAPTAQPRELGLLFYYFTLFLGTVVYAAANGVPALRRLFALSLVVSLAGMALSVVLPSYFETVAALGEARTHYQGRAFGFFMQPNRLAQSILLLFIGWFALWRRKNTVLEVLIILGFLGVMFLTGSRTAIGLAGITAALIIGYSWRAQILRARYVLRITLLVLCVAVGVAGARLYLSTLDDGPGFGLFKRMDTMLSLEFLDTQELVEDRSVQERLETQRVYLALIRERPVLGRGFGADVAMQEDGRIFLSAHSRALTSAMEYGVVYPLAFVLLLVSLYFRRGRRTAHDMFGTNTVTQFVTVLLIMFVMSGGILDFRAFYIVLGLVYAAVSCPNEVFGLEGAGMRNGPLVPAARKRRAAPETAEGADRKLRVLYVLPCLSHGGAQGFVTNLGVALAGAGVTVRFYLLGGVRDDRGQALLERLRAAGITVAGIENRKAASLKNFPALFKQIRAFRPDIVQASLYAAEVACAVARMVCGGRDTRYVRRLANTNFTGYRSPRLVRAFDRFYALTVACSPSVAGVYEDFMGAKRRSEIVTIPNGGALCASVPAKHEKEAARSELGIAEEAYVVAHIGRMYGGDRADSALATGQKAHDVMLNAFARAFGNDPRCLLLLVGDGPLRPAIEVLARDLGLADRVRFLGFVAEPWPALMAADVFFFPSRYEGLPNVLPEAASCGLPVVASDIREIGDIAPEEGWLLSPVDDVAAFAQSLRRVRENQADWCRLALEVAPDFRARFSMESCARAYLRVYQEALGHAVLAGGQHNTHAACLK
ncbi:MAG: glycosyltransferase [Candidatus Hydrogenedentota bacterium]